MLLDLGEVRGTAEVFVDGESAGVRVCSPYTFDLTGRIGPGGATLEVLVLNTLGPHLDAVSPTPYVFAGQRRSGLFGPVRILMERDRPGPMTSTVRPFLPYILRTVGSQSQAASVALQSASFVLTAVFTVLVFMRFSDRGYVPRRIIWAAGAVMQITAFVLFLVLPFTTPVAMANVALFGIGAALAGEAFYKVWSQELFPTLLRGTAQGITFGTARVALGVWSFFVPVLAETGIRPVAALLTAFLVISGVIGFFFMPHTAGRPLEDIEEERAPAPLEA